MPDLPEIDIDNLWKAIKGGSDYPIAVGDEKPVAIVVPYEKYTDLLKAWADLQLDGKR
ncbi:Uncharacterised protein [Mycobacteroides abscessus subsp. abscessus]|uniref:Antitoxin n=1 Tax=Mycobacteroides abscessus TaxID=36809 RepID=A0AB33T437_9MYCO|nr:hypothetical protein [Mycobacteroides abscessus]MBE5405661.1 hypothetical protein [Mycobacteroides abscessus]MBE5429629.1 hypothetical protein [Mycobacteroides abscessus]MBE5498643.1 hypothetical protein [Mycobacteroides abscessus]MBN7428825.1 hypothetical protein [Mycobacteroides abscessus subsp. massiliense]MBN7467460.1 hypothetical protein [Mycobacteroides abscessus subsp. massiliense]